MYFVSFILFVEKETIIVVLLESLDVCMIFQISQGYQLNFQIKSFKKSGVVSFNPIEFFFRFFSFFGAGFASPLT